MYFHDWRNRFSIDYFSGSGSSGFSSSNDSNVLLYLVKVSVWCLDPMTCGMGYEKTVLYKISTESVSYLPFVEIFPF